VEEILGKLSEGELNELLELGGMAVDAYLYIKELEDKLNSVKSEIQKNMPICPVCKVALTPLHLSHYYSEGPMAMWECNCEKFPENLNPQRVHQGY